MGNAEMIEDSKRVVHIINQDKFVFQKPERCACLTTQNSSKSQLSLITGSTTFWLGSWPRSVFTIADSTSLPNQNKKRHLHHLLWLRQLPRLKSNPVQQLTVCHEPLRDFSISSFANNRTFLGRVMTFWPCETKGCNRTTDGFTFLTIRIFEAFWRCFFFNISMWFGFVNKQCDS